MKRYSTAEPFEIALSHDLLIRKLYMELFIIFGAAAIILILFSRILLPALILIFSSVLIALQWASWEFKRKKRRLRLCRVRNVKIITYNGSPQKIDNSLLSINYAYYVVEISYDGMSAKYIDFEERNVGENLIVLFDHKDRVIAVAPLSNPPKLEILKKLG